MNAGAALACYGREAGSIPARVGFYLTIAGSTPAPPPQTEKPPCGGFPLHVDGWRHLVQYRRCLVERCGKHPLSTPHPSQDRKAYDTGTGGHYSAPYNWQKRPATTKTRSLDMHRRVRITGDCGSPTGSRSAFNTRPFSPSWGTAS